MMRKTRRVNESWCSCLFYLFIMLEGFFLLFGSPFKARVLL